MVRTQAIFYRDENGHEPVDEFVETLPPKRAAKIDEFVGEHLNGQRPAAPPPSFPITSQIDGELRELRVRFGKTRYRILYQRSENLIVLLHAFEKNTGPVSLTQGFRRGLLDKMRRLYRDRFLDLHLSI